MKRLLLLILLLGLAPLAAAQVNPEERLLQAIGKDSKIVPNWTIAIVDESWWKLHGNPSTQTASTDLKSRTTHIRESYVIHGTFSDIRFTLLHEAGHLSCNCNIEEIADKFARAHF